MAQGISIPVVQSGLQASIQQAVKNVGTININASVDPSAFKNLAQPLGRVSGLATEFEKSIAASNARVLAFGASVGIINGVQNAFSTLVQTGIEVQKTLADIGAISGKSGQELSKFGDSLFEIGKTTGQTFQTASQAALEFSRQGLTVEQTLKRTSDALTLTRFTTLSASEAVDVLTAAANSFIETGITTAQIINKLVAVDTKFAVSAEDLAKGLARAGSIAQEVGVNFDQLNAAVTVAQERTTRGGAVIGNALKTIFTRLRSDETVQALRNVGVESLDAQGQLKGAIPLLEELSKKMQGLSGGEKIQILEAVASKYNINILSALLNDLGDANSKFGQAVQVSAGAGNQAYERQIELNKTLAAQINNTTVSVTQLFNKLSEIGVTESLATLLKFVGDLINSFNKLLSSESVGGDIAKGLIKGISDVFFTVGLPILAAIFVKLTTDIAKFGVESLKTILGINQQVRERQALEQAVVNTLIRDQEVMASILALSGNRAKQEEYLLGVYNRQLTALQQVQSIASSVTPGLMAGGLSATSGQVKKRGAGGYLPSQEAADVRRGVGGASSSSKVVSIPNFAFGGGKRGTMIANTSEYVVPNFANGGSAVFNQDMARAYGLPAGAKKISAAGGYVPNFNRYVYDADRIEPDKNSLLKAILASKAKKNLIVGPAGSGKSTYGASLGSFITNPNQLADATEVDILSGAARTKDGGMSKNFQQIADAVNLSGGKISYLYAGNMDILSRRRGRIDAGPQEGDLRSEKQIAGSMYAPLNQFDFISKVKSSAKNFEMIRGAGGYIPNFANEKAPEFTGQYAGIVPNKEAGPSIQQGKDKNGKLRSFPMVYAGSGANSKANIDDIRNEVVRTSKNLAIRAATDYAKAFDPDLSTDTKGVAEKATQANQNKGAIESFVGSIFEASIASLLSDQNFTDSQDRSTISTFDFQNNPELQRIFSIPKSIQFLEAKNNALEPNLNKIAEKISKVQGGGEAFSQKRPTIADTNVAARYFTKGETGYLEKDKNVFEKVDLSKLRLGPNQLLKNGLPSGATIRGSSGYIPNFAQGGPLEDAIQREMAAGLDPSQIRVTKDGKLKNSQNPNGFAVINTRDEPNGRVPNFARELFQNSKGTWIRSGTNQPASNSEISAYLSEQADIKSRANLSPQQAVQAVQAGPASSITPKQQDDKSLLTTNKLMAGFIGLQIVTSTLQSTFKQTDSAVAKAITAFSQIGASVAGYGAIGGMLGDGLKGMTGKLGKLAGFLGPAGMIAGAGIGIYSAVQESKAAENAGYEQKGKSAAELKLRSIDATSANEQEAMQKKREELWISAKAVQDLTLEKQTAQLEENKRARSLMQSTGGAMDQISPFPVDVGPQFDPAITAALKEKTTIQEALQVQQQAYQEAEVRRGKEKIIAEATFTSELKQRVALVTKISDIEIAASNGFVTTQKLRTDAQAEFIKNASLYTQAQRDQIQDQQVLKEIEYKRLDVQKQILEDALKQVADKKLATVSEEKLKSLMAQLEAGKDLENVAKTIEGLDAIGLNNLKEILKLTQKRTIENNNAAKSSDYDTKEKTKGLRIDQERVKLAEIYAKSLESQLDFSRSMEDIRTAGTQGKEDLLAREKVVKIENEISRKPFASATDERKLVEANALLATLTETRNIQRAYDNEVKQANRARQDSYSKAASSLTMLGAEEVKILNTLIKTNKLDEARAYMNEKGYVGTESESQDKQLYQSATAMEDADQKHSEQLAIQQEYRDIAIKQLKEQITYTVELARLREKSPARAGAVRALTEIDKEISGFKEAFSYSTTLGFRDGLRDAMGAAISQTDDLGAALQNVAMGFLKTMQNAFLQNAANNITSSIGIKMGIPMAKGGVVSGGSGYRDDVPAMLTGGEFVMRKSAVQKYGASNLERMNSGGMFVPGTRGGGAISGDDALRAFANQSTTSGATDVLKGNRSSAFINLEDESQKLSRYALLGDDTINQEVRGAKIQAFDILKNKSDFEKQQKEAEKQQKKALMRQMIGTVAGAALSYGVGKAFPAKIGAAGAAGGAPKLDLMSQAAGKTQFLSGAQPFKMPGQAYGGMIRRYASGGPTDDIQAMLMSGEYVMNRGASRKYGKQFLDSMNQGRAPRFADGGEAAPSSPTTTTDSNVKGMGDVNININVTGQTSQTETQGNSSQGGIDYKKMSEKIKMVVMETLNEEKRLGGSLRTR